MIKQAAAGVLLAAALTTISVRSDAFCGFYVGGAGAKMFNDATVVVLMREGTRTVLSMQNTYKGPPEKFAMVVPVPVVLQEENVKTLERALFDHIDQLAAPRLVEYWEQDPCAPDTEMSINLAAAKAAPAPQAVAEAAPGNYGVTIEAKFTVGEYQIVILSAKDSGGLEDWLHAEQYTIPERAEPYFRPYVAAGSKFFVAKVDPQKVKMVDGLAELSPLRFHYDSDEFRLPVRLGLINSSGTQDLIVHILGRGTRYEVANYPNVTIPTNFDVSEEASSSFGSFYAALFDRTVAKNPKAVVTEYAWEPTSCDPCPGPALDMGDLTSLGGDVLPSSTIPSYQAVPLTTAPGFRPPPPPPKPTRPTFNAWAPGGQGQMVLTRLHVRYTKDSLGEDLVFKAAPAIIGGREVRDANGELEHGATKTSSNNFQARYAIRHPWTGPITCKEPKRGRWGGNTSPRAAQKLGLVKRTNTDLASFVKQDIPEIDFKRGSAASDGSKKGCLGCATIPRDDAGGVLPLALAGALAFVRSLRRRSLNRDRL